MSEKPVVVARRVGTGEEQRALDAYVKLVRAAESVTARLAGELAASGLTLSQFGTLEALYHLGPLCQSDLGAKILKSSGTMTTVVDNLEQRRLVHRLRDDRDRRRVLVRLTDEGRQLIHELFPGHLRSIVREMGVLSSTDQEELARLSRSVGLGVHDSGQPS